MRTLLLLVLGAGIVWFVWRGLGQAETGEAHAAPGSMLNIEAVAQPLVPPPGASAGGQQAQESARSPGGANDAGGVPTIPLGSAAQPQPTATTEISSAAGDSAGASASSPNREPPRGSGMVMVEGAAPAARGSLAPVSAPGAARAGAVAPFSPEEVAAAQDLLRDRVAFEARLVSRSTGLDPARHDVATALVHALATRDIETRSALERAEASGGLSDAERELALRIVAGRGGPIFQDSALGRAASIVAEERAAFAALDASRFADAAGSFSRLLLAEIGSPRRAEAALLERWSLGVREAQRKNRWNPRGKWRSTEVVVQAGDSLIHVRRRAVAADPNLVVCTGQIARANGLEGQVIHPGMKLRIPLDPVHVLVDLDAHWALYLAGTEVIAAWPVGVGSESSATRLGNFTVGSKMTKEPMWFPQGRKPVPFGDPANPLGTRWIPWNGADGLDTGLGFHGTNDPSSIGRDASLGCIRMRTADVEELYDILPVGAPIQVVP